MPGIYSRDNISQQLAQNLENALERREANRKREADRVDKEVAALIDGGKAIGRWWETRKPDDKDILQKLLEERQEAVAAQQEHDNEIRSQFRKIEPPQTSSIPAAQEMQGYVPYSAYADAMRGYVPTEAMYASRPTYSDVIKRGGLY